MSYLRLMANPDDNTAFLRIVNVPRREIGATTLEKLGAYANRRDTGLLAACNEFGLQEFVDSRRLRRLREFHDWMTHHQRLAREQRISSALLKLLQEIDYMDILRERSTSEQVAERRWENVLELVEWLQRLEQKEKTAPDELVNHLMLQDILENVRTTYNLLEAQNILTKLQITDLNGPCLATAMMGEPEQFTFAGWNGETVYAYVVKPYDFSEEAAALRWAAGT